MPLKPFKPFKALRRGRGTGAGMVGLDVARSRHGLGMGEARVGVLVAMPWHGLYHGWFLVSRLGHGRVMGFIHKTHSIYLRKH